MDDERIVYGMYGIHIYLEDAKEGFIELAYTDYFGVCGTGLEEENVTLAGGDAHVGTYDNGDVWSFITFEGEKEGIIAQTFDVDF